VPCHFVKSEVLSPILFDESNNPRTLELTMGQAGVGTRSQHGLVAEAHFATQTYSGPSVSWATVTPVLLDRMPRPIASKIRLLGVNEVAGIIFQSCATSACQIRSRSGRETPFFVGHSARCPPGRIPQLRKTKFKCTSYRVRPASPRPVRSALDDSWATG